jgi:hypothetical protein
MTGFWYRKMKGTSARPLKSEGIAIAAKGALVGVRGCLPVFSSFSYLVRR